MEIINFKPEPRNGYLKIRPEPQDYEEAERLYGKPKSDSDRDLAQHYRLAQVIALARVYRK